MTRLSTISLVFVVALIQACLLDTSGLLHPDTGPDADADVDEECTPTDEVCDGLDNDCDEAIDEDFEFQSDEENCGRCGVACAGRSHAVEAECDSGECRIVSCVPSDAYCSTGYSDCDGRFDNGCEACLNSDLHCGDCDTRCDPDRQCRRIEDNYECVPRPEEGR